MEICAETGRIYGILTSRNTVGKDEKLRNGIAFKSIAGIVALLIVFSVIVSIIGYVEFTDALMQQCAGGAFYTADASALTVKADHLQMNLQTVYPRPPTAV